MMFVRPRDICIKVACLVLWAVSGPVHGQDDDGLGPLRLIGSTVHGPIGEMSGMVKSRRYPGVFWVHNDSGDVPRLFAIDRTGRVIITRYMKREFHAEVQEEGKRPWQGIEILLAANQDWEDIAIDDDLIYIADLGNNSNVRRDMGIYVLYEPNPSEVHEARILGFLPVRYPEQDEYPAKKWHFDSEALFAADASLYVLTKHRKAGQPMGWEAGVNLYRLDSRDTGSANVLKKVDSHESLTLATGADVSPDGSHLAIVSYAGLWVFDKPERGDKWLSGKSRMLPLSYGVTAQVEAVCWDGNDTIMMSNEQRKIYAVDLKDVPPSP